MRKRRDFGNKGIIIIFILLKIIISKKNPLMKKKNMNLTTLEEFKEKNYGKRGTKKRDELEAGYESFKLGALIQDTRLEMGMTQEQLAEKVGTTKS